METALRYDSVNRNLILHASENFVSDDNIILSVRMFGVGEGKKKSVSMLRCTRIHMALVPIVRSLFLHFF